MVTATPQLALAKSTQNVLNSWKEIATYLDRGIRTVQRWEAELGLPVRRPRGKRRSAVIAMRADLDAWLKACPLSVRENYAVRSNGSAHLKNGNRMRDGSPSDLVLKCRGLQVEMELNKAGFRQALNNLIESLGQLAPSPLASESEGNHDKQVA
jgi:hypothetical protein